VSMHGHGTNSHSLKILPASDGAPRISAVVGEFISDRKSTGLVSVRTARRANGKTEQISGCARENLEPAFFAENRVGSRGRGARVHASKVKKHHGFVGGMADMTLVISGARG